ncbi:Hypothetical protein D9617_2g058830 [Elsinoe fawcettii]|nr:Hypothetical protein D9617_2g058830 [Elsinoe fawcettii]
MQAQILRGNSYGLFARTTSVAAGGQVDPITGLPFPSRPPPVRPSLFDSALPEDPFGPAVSEALLATKAAVPTALKRTPKSQIPSSGTAQRRSTRLSTKRVSYAEDSPLSQDSPDTAILEDRDQFAGADDLEEETQSRIRNDQNKTSGITAGWPKLRLTNNASSRARPKSTSFTSVDFPDVATMVNEDITGNAALASDRPAGYEAKSFKLRKVPSWDSESTLSEALDVSTPSAMGSPRKKRRLDAESPLAGYSSPRRSSNASPGNPSPTKTIQSTISVDLNDHIRMNKARSSASTSPDKVQGTPRSTPKVVDMSPFRKSTFTQSGSPTPLSDSEIVMQQLQASQVYSPATTRILRQHRAKRANATHKSVIQRLQEEPSRPPSREGRYQDLNVSFTDDNHGVHEPGSDADMMGGYMDSPQQPANTSGQDMLNDSHARSQDRISNNIIETFQSYGDVTTSHNPLAYSANAQSGRFQASQPYHDYQNAPIQDSHYRAPCDQGSIQHNSSFPGLPSAVASRLVTAAGSRPQSALGSRPQSLVGPEPTPAISSYQQQYDPSQGQKSFEQIKQHYEKQIHAMRLQQVQRSFEFNPGYTSYNSTFNANVQQPELNPYHRGNPAWSIPNMPQMQQTHQVQQSTQSAIPPRMYSRLIPDPPATNSPQMAQAFNPVLQQTRAADRSAVPSPAISHASFPTTDQLLELFPELEHQ